MSKYHIEAEKTVVIDGVEHKESVDKDVTVDFSATNYMVKPWDGGERADFGFELVPDNVGFLHEVTDIFPLSEYDVRIIQRLHRPRKAYNPYVSLCFDVRRKGQNKRVFTAEAATLSDKDYNYVRDILLKEMPDYGWKTAEAYLRWLTGPYLWEVASSDLLSDDAFEYLSKMVLKRLDDIKVDGFVDLDDEIMKSVASEVLEDALRSWFEINEKK